MFGRILMSLLLTVSLNVWAEESTETRNATAENSTADAKDAQHAAPGTGAAGASGANDAQGATPGKDDPIFDESATDPATCAAKWARFHKSQECFAPYHNVNGSWKPGAFEHCKVYKSPDECPLENWH